jgi:hypothetical protein
MIALEQQSITSSRLWVATSFNLDQVASGPLKPIDHND